MVNIALFLLGTTVFAVALGWRPKWDVVLSAASGAWAGLKVIFSGDISGWAWARRFASIVGVFLIVLALFVGGPATLGPRDALDKAIRDFQAYAGLTVDGIFGPATVKAYYGKR